MPPSITGFVCAFFISTLLSRHMEKFFSVVWVQIAVVVRWWACVDVNGKLSA